MEHIRATLDSLMGVNRNGDKKYLEIKHFTDERVCKYDLMGFCPYHSRLRMSACPSQQCPVNPTLKQQYEKEKSQGKRFKFEEDTIRYYERLIRDVEREKVRNSKRLEVQNKTSVRDQDNEEIIAIEKEMHRLTNEIEKAGEEGEVEEALEKTSKLEELTKEKEALKARTNKTGNHQELIVCDVCAKILSVNETDQRLADHFAGTTHLGYQKVREQLEKLQKEIDSFSTRNHHHSSHSGKSNNHYGRPRHYKDNYERRAYKRRRY
mmetsp:Transcript_8498/g.12536  ORF Transcript_8498/g.12536 Transcript_8498/m.12536 type:complete len:265 (+) Transcript_8498:53-847(+)